MNQHITTVVISVLTSSLVVALFILFFTAVNNPGSAEWLGFLGSMVGALLAIIGAIWIESLKRQSRRREELGLLKHGLEELLRMLRPILENKPEIDKIVSGAPSERALREGDKERLESLLLVETRYRAVKQRIELIEHFFSSRLIDDARLWISVHGVIQGSKDTAVKTDEPEFGEKGNAKSLHTAARYFSVLADNVTIPTQKALDHIRQRM